MLQYQLYIKSTAAYNVITFFSNYSELVQSFIEGTTLLICIMTG